MSQEYREENDEYDKHEKIQESKESNNSKKEIFALELGDIIEIIAPSNQQLHESSFFISYINERRLQLVNIATLEEVHLNINEEGGLTDESIREIHLLNRSEVAGYARQNHLEPGTWIEIHFGGEVTTILTGEITNLEEDQIEITTYPDLNVIYIDFEYKGIPEDIPIQKIVIREKPASLKSLKTLGLRVVLDESDVEEKGKTNIDSDEPYIEYLETGESIINADENALAEEHIVDVLQNMVSKSKGLIYGEDLEEITQVVEIPESQKRYGIDAQTNSILDELLSTIPSAQRSKEIMEKVHTLINRYRELRGLFSIFDENGNIKHFKKNDPNFHKPLVEHIKQMDVKLNWVLPVVSTKKKLYIDPKYDDVAEMHETDDSEILNFDAMVNYEENLKRDIYYKNNAITDEGKYFNLYRQLTDLLTPFENPDENIQSLSKIHVKTNIETIVDNLDDFYSSVLHVYKNQSNLVKRQYVIQTYGLGLNKLMKEKRGGRDSVVSVPLTSSDKLTVKSVVLLPFPVVNYSRIHMPETTILEKANLHFNPVFLFRLLRKSEIAPYIVDDLTKELQYADSGEAGDTESIEFLASMRNYILSDNITGMDDSDKFEMFLKTIVPKTRTLVRMIRKYIRDKLSFVEVVRSLEPFMIYSQDISYKQYMEIRHFIIEQIKERKEVLNEKRKEYSVLTNAKFDITRESLFLIRALLEKNDLLELFITGYKLPEKEVLEKSSSSQEVLEIILQKDNGILFTKLVASVMSSLITPDSLANLFDNHNGDEIDDMNKNEKIKAEDCHKRILTKRYQSIVELQKDNNTSDVYYDKEFDDTPYHILDKYKDDEKRMLPDKFVGFLAENLVQKHDCPREKSVELAKRMIAGKKEVGDGEYAILEVRPQLKTGSASMSSQEKEDLEEEAKNRSYTKYYHRKKDNWIFESDVDEESFVDTKGMFCNMNKNCLINEQTIGNDKCESTDEVAIRMREIARKKINKEFDRRYEMSFENMKENLEKNVVNHIKYLHRLMRLRSVKSEKVNNYCYALGSLLSSDEERVQSPYVELRELILGQEDFVKKQKDIVRFFDAFCREPLENLEEDPHWKYCKETNTKLLPDFLYDLAFCFITGGNYTLKLEEICHTHGLLSDSGDAIVDKYSGYRIRMIDFSDEEGYDEAGFKISTRAFIEKDADEAVLEGILKISNKTMKKQVCEGERSQMICDILESISSNIGIPIADVREVALTITSAVCDKLIIDEAAYVKQAKKEEETKGVKLPTYKKRSNQLRILITASVLFSVIQTQLPSFVVKRTFPGCVKSFKGYPLTGEEDNSGLKYFACIMNKMKASFEPWDSIKSMTVDMIVQQMKKIMVSGVLKNSEMDQRYLKKREFLVSFPEEEIPEEHGIEKWKHFLPPIVDTNVIQNLKGVSADFKDEFISMMKKGMKDQLKDFLVFKSKISYFSYAIVEAIQKIVSNKNTILNTISSGKPFLQNACCNETTEYVPIYYFIKENEDIAQYIRTLGALSKIVDNVLQISKAQILYDPRPLVSKFPVLSTEISENNIYGAFIHYCELDKKQGVPSKFHAFFTEIPKGYNSGWSIEEKIEFLKKSDKKFSLSQLNELMRIIHTENIVSLYEKQKSNPVEMMKDILGVFENQESPIIDDSLREKLLKVLQKYDKTKLISIFEEGGDNDKLPLPEKEKMEAVKNLKNSLVERIVENFKPAVLAFLKKYGKLGKNDFGRLTAFFDTFVKKWASDDIYKTVNFIKNAVDEMTRIFPTILLTNVSNNDRIHEYWSLSDLDKMKLFRTNSEYYEPLGQFRNDSVLQLLLIEIKKKFVDLQLFFENLPIHSPIMRNGREYFGLFDKETVLFLLEYIFLSVIHEYIIATDERDLIRTDIFEKKKSNREKILENQDVSIQFQTEYGELNEEYEDVNNDISEIQIDIGNKEELKTRVAKLLLAFINIMRKNKNEINISYDNIATAIRKKKENEKNRIVQRFERLSNEEREIENMKKKFKLDEWNIGMQKGLIVYDQKTSDRERMEQENEEQLDIEKHGIRKADFMMILSETYDNDDINPSALDVDIENEEDVEMGLGIDSLKSNFHDGQFYSDDDSDDGFGYDD